MELINQTINEVAAVSPNFGNEELTAQDLLIPKIQLVQVMSEAFKAKLADEGDFFDSLEKKSLGKEFVGQVFYIGKVFRFFEDDNKRQYIKTEPVTAENNDGDFSRKSLVYQLSVLVGDTVGNRAAYGISLAKTHARTGRRLATLFAKRGGTAGVLLRFGGIPEKNDEGSWIGWDFKVERDATQAEIVEAFAWFKSLKAGRVKVAEDEDLSTEKPVADVGDDEMPF